MPDGIELRVAELIDGQSIVLRAQPGLPWDGVWSFHVIPHWDDRCRLVIRSRLALRRPAEFAVAELFGPARAFITRGILLGVKRRAEGRGQPVTSGASEAVAGAALHREG